MTSAARRSAAEDAIRTVVGNRALRRIEIAWALGTAGDAAYVVALVVAAFDYGGAGAVGVLTAVRMLPSIVGAPLAGLLAGRRPPTRLLFAAHAIRAAAALVGTAALAADSPAGVLLAATVAASAGAFVRPLQVAAMPSMARSPDELVAANVASGIGEGVGAFAGPLVAGLTLAVSGPLPTAALAAVAFGAAAAALAGPLVSGDAAAEHLAERQKLPPVPLTVATVSAELTAGLRSLARHHGAAVLMASLAGQVFVRGLMTTLGAVIAIDLVGLGEPGVGTLWAAYGIGTLLGAAAAVRVARGGALGRTFAGSLAMWGLPLAVVAILPHPAVALAAFAITGVANGSLDVSGFTLLQRIVPRVERMAVFGLLEAVVALGLATGGAIAPILIQTLGARVALAVAGALLPAIAIASWIRVRRVDHEVAVPEARLRLLRGIPLFAPLPLTALERLAEALEPRTVIAGTTVIAEGEPGSEYFLIERGEVEVRARGRLINAGGPGDGFGEIALVADVPRTATVVAVTDLDLLVLDSSDFLAAIAGPSVAPAMTRLVEERLARSAG